MMRILAVVLLLGLLGSSNATPQDFDLGKLATLLTKLWQKSLNTNEDPSDGGRYYTNSPSNQNVGLYGGLSDEINQTVNFDVKNKNFQVDQFTADHSIANNTDGLMNFTTTTLSFTHGTETTQEHTTSNTFKFGLGIEVKASATIFGLGVDVTTKFSFDYTYSMSDTSSSTTTDVTTYSQEVPIHVPKGKVYEAILTATKQTLTVPTTIVTTVKGIAETWFPDRVNGHYNWFYTNSGDLFEAIRYYGVAGDLGSQYTSQGNNGILTSTGTMTGINAVNFVAQIIDITGLSEVEREKMHAYPALIPPERIVTTFA